MRGYVLVAWFIEQVWGDVIHKAALEDATKSERIARYQPTLARNVIHLIYRQRGCDISYPATSMLSWFH